MFSNPIRLLFLILISIIAGTLCVLPARAVSPLTGGTTSSITVNVKCAGQGQVDADHRITLRVDGPGGTPTTVTVDVQKSTTASAIALQVKSALTSNGVAATGPTANAGYPVETAFDLKLPDGYKLGDVKVEKKSSSGGWGTDDGHLKVINSQKMAFASGLTPPPSPVPGFSTFVLKENSWVGQVKVIEITIRGVNSAGTGFEYTNEWTYNGVYPLPSFSGVGQFLQRKGMAVTYPSNSEMSVDLTTSGLNVYEVDFVVHADASVNPQQLWTSHVEFTAN